MEPRIAKELLHIQHWLDLEQTQLRRYANASTGGHAHTRLRSP